MKGCRPLTDSEIATVKGAFARTRDKALFILGLKTGLRISELLSLKVGDVYQYGRLADVVYVERKHMKNGLFLRALSEGKSRPAVGKQRRSKLLRCEPAQPPPARQTEYLLGLP
jgi:integrase